MQTSNNSTINTTLNQLVQEPVPPIHPSNPEGQSGINPINPSGSLAEQAGPGLSTRQAQPIATNTKSVRQRIYEADQLLKKGQKEEAGLIYSSISSNTDETIRDRLSCAKKLLKISSIYAQTLSTAHLLVEIVNDPKIEGADRLEAIKILAKWPRFQDQAVLAFKAFSAVFESQTIEPWIQNSVKDCIVPLLFSRVKDLTLFPTDRILAAEELSKLVDEDQQGEVWSALLNERLTYIHPNYGMKVAEKLGKIPAYRACAAGYLLYFLRLIENYVPWRTEALEKLSKIPGYETIAADCLIFLSQNLENPLWNNNNTAYLKHWNIAEALSAIPGQEANAAKTWLDLVKGRPPLMVPLHHTAEMLSKIDGQEEKIKEIWAFVAEYDHAHPAVVASRILGMRALFDLCGEKDKAAELLTKLAEDQQEPIEHRLLAVDNLARIPEKEAEAARMKSNLEAMLQDTKCKIESAKNNLQIPDKKQEAAELLVQIAKNPTLAFSDRMLAGDTLSAVPEQTPKAIEAWLAINACPKLIRYKQILAAGKLSHLPGQAQRARELVDRYMLKISDAGTYFLV